MTRGKRHGFFGMLIAALLFTGLSSSNANTVVDEQWPIPNTPWPGFYSSQIDDGRHGYGFSVLRVQSETETVWCTAADEGECATAERLVYDAYLPVCESESQTNCIEALSATGPNGTRDQAKFDGYTLPDHPNDFPGHPDLNIPDSASPGMWILEQTPHSTGNLYGLSVLIQGAAERGRPITTGDISIRLAPVKFFDGVAAHPDSNGFFSYGHCQQIADPVTGRRQLWCGTGAEELGERYCSYKLKGAGDCLLRQPFPKDVRFQVRVRLAAQPSGWLHGRLDSPEISISPRTGGGVTLDVTAGSVRVPTFYAGSHWADMPSRLKDFYNECVTSGTCGTNARIPNPLNTPRPVTEASVMDNPPPSSPRAMEVMALWMDLAKDTAVAVPSAWTLRTIGHGGGSDPRGCLRADASGVKGIVSTNATAYSDGPPAFDGTQLDYSVMAPHYEPDGKTAFEGTYNLVMRSDVARCLYRFSTAPVQASISVIGSDGTTRVATTTTSERNGWLRLSANGFTFSSPTIRVRLSQEAPAAVSVPAAPAPVEVRRPARTVITCAKGTQIKRVRAVQPKCPSGWRPRRSGR